MDNCMNCYFGENTCLECVDGYYFDQQQMKCIKKNDPLGIIFDD